MTSTSYSQTLDLGSLTTINSATQANIDTTTSAQSGMLVYNTTVNRLMFFNGTTWEGVDSSSQLIDSVYVSQDSLFITQNSKLFKVRLVNRTPQTLVPSGGTITWNTKNGMSANTTLTSATTALSITNAVPGCYGTLIVRQDATGGRLITLPAGSKLRQGGTVPLTSTPLAVDLLCFYYDGTNFYWTYGNNFN